MKVHRRGHNYQAKGAVGLIDEVVEADKVNRAVGKYFDLAKENHIDVSPGNCDVNTDLRYGVNIANSRGATLFFSIHFNKAYNSYVGAIGSEVCVKSNMPEAQRVLDNLQKLGFKNRGQKIRNDLYELNMTSMRAMIIEVCFCEATEDVAIYNKVGADAIGKAIVEGILNINISNSNNSNANNSEEVLEVNLFSEEYYLKTNPDVVEAIKQNIFKNGYEHYVKYGKKEGRSPLPTIPKDFNEGEYLELNPDVAKGLSKEVNSGLAHYLRWGWAEKRKVSKADTQQNVDDRVKQLEKEKKELEDKLKKIDDIIH